ncbi:MAG: hypothetical protein KG029_16840, partial [Bacteroidetes bacterium]|nr:hypothetical protein [Bacteroidota bacterium]
KDVTARFINGYVPAYENEDLAEEAVNRILAGKKSEKKKEELFDSMGVGIPKTFAYIAKIALNLKGYSRESGNPEYDWIQGQVQNDQLQNKKLKYCGIEALGILKADVDNLGLLFACGIREERLTLSRLATMSRQMNNYFSIFLPYKLKTDERFQNIYTVFAGGDDLFLIGAWNRIIDFAGFLHDSFKEYSCRNEQITISAGVALHKPNTPVLTFAETSENALEKSKMSGRDRVTIFGETAKWIDFIKLQEVKHTIENWLDSEKINNAMLFRVNELIEMRRQESEIQKSKFNIQLEDMECLKWRSRLKYTIVRNIGRKLKGDDKQKAIDEAMNVADWLETYKGTLKIPLWQIIYNRR